MPARSSLLLALSAPTTGILVASYLYYRPLPLLRSTKIPQSHETSHSLRTVSGRSLETVNPRNHVLLSDSRSITLLKPNIAKSRKEVEKGAEIGDEEILARFLKGFFGGWSFTPERGLIALLTRLGKKFIPVGYSGFEVNGEKVNSLEELSKMKLPEKGTVLFGGNFMVLDVHISPPSPLLEESYVDISYNDPVISYIDIGFGDNRRNFAGLHRFEIQHHGKKEGGEGMEEEEVTIWFSSMSCNPSVDRPPFPKWVFGFHIWYSMCLFKDGIEQVIRG